MSKYCISQVVDKTKKKKHHKEHDAVICGRSAKNGKSTDEMARLVFSMRLQQVPENTACLETFLGENTGCLLFIYLYIY